MNTTLDRTIRLTDTALDGVHGGISAEKIISEVGSGAYSGFKCGSKFGTPGRVAGTLIGGLIGLGTACFC